MSRKQFTVRYLDGSKQRVSARERDSMLLASLIEHVARTEYRYIGVALTLHAMSGLGQLQPIVTKRYLPGVFTFELRGKKSSEREQTVDAMLAQLKSQGFRVAQQQGAA